MIKYRSGSYGFSILLRAHGSAVFKSLVPALSSSVVYLVLYEYTDLHEDDGQVLEHPYPAGALIAALTFLLAFRANFSYNRYWEAMTATYQMHSKWLDVGMEIAAFHLQADCYAARRPPAFGSLEDEEIQTLERARERLHEPTFQEMEEHLEEILEGTQNDALDMEPAPSGLQRKVSKFLRRRKKPKKEASDLHGSSRFDVKKDINASPNSAPKAKGGLEKTVTFPDRRHSGDTFGTPVVTSKPYQPKAFDQPPLFLQEAAHFLSLLSAVAFSTLRNDVEEAESPLITFHPGKPWPHVDPDAYTADVRKEWAISPHRTYTILRYLLGFSRTPKQRTLYNAARPFRVIGGVSDAEIELLQAARGPLAKVALVTMWLQEFISRESLAGSTGKVAPPIISRLYQFLSDGMLGYNQARKIAQIPFPFPHAQITALFVFVVVFFMPVLMLSFLSNESVGFTLNLLTVMCFTGLHEVSRELENPFQNVPNDIPLNNFQAQFNESLMNMFMGFHPDAYWEVCVEQGPQPQEEKEEEEKEEEEEDESEGNGDLEKKEVSFDIPSHESKP